MRLLGNLKSNKVDRHPLDAGRKSNLHEDVKRLIYVEFTCCIQLVCKNFYDSKVRDTKSLWRKAVLINDRVKND